MTGIYLGNVSYNSIEKDIKIKKIASDFEAILLKEILKVAFKPLTEKKSFYQRMYYDMFLDSISKKLASAGGVGIARFIIENLNDRDRYSSEQQNRSGFGEIRRPLSQKSIYRKGA